MGNKWVYLQVVGVVVIIFGLLLKWNWNGLIVVLGLALLFIGGFKYRAERGKK